MVWCLLAMLSSSNSFYSLRLHLLAFCQLLYWFVANLFLSMFYWISWAYLFIIFIFKKQIQLISMELSVWWEWGEQLAAHPICLTPKIVHLETLQLGGQTATPVHLGVLFRWRCHYPCRAEATYLAHGFKEAFTFLIKAVCPCHLQEFKDYKWLGGCSFLGMKLEKELECSCLSGLHNSLLLPKLGISPLVVAPKKAPGQFRLIHHLSHQRGEFSEWCYWPYALFT